MIKKYILLFIMTYSIALNQMAYSASTTVKLGAYSVGYEFCQKIQQIAAILNAYSTVQWPISGVAGYTYGIVQSESVVLKMCDFIIQLQSLDTEGSIFHTARYLNELTGNKWDAELNQADLTWNIANSVYDFRGNGGYKQGALSSPYVHAQLVDYADKTKKYFQKKKQKPGDPEPEGIEDKVERRAKLDKIAQLSYQRAILNEATACPSDKASTNNQELWQKEMIPQKENVDKKREAVKYYQEQFMKMGPDFLVEVDELQAFKTSLQNIIDKGFKFDYTIRYTDVKRKAATGKTNKDGTPEVKETTEKRPYQLITVQQNYPVFSDFNNKYSAKWKSFIESQYLTTGTFGLFDDKKGRIEEKYRSYSYECSESNLKDQMSTKDRNDPAYVPELTKLAQQCQANLKVREKDVESIFEKYTRLLESDLRSAKQSQAKMWTFESKFIGTMPLEKDSTSASEMKTEETVRLKAIQAPQKECRAEFTPAEMAKLNLDMQNVNNELTQTIAENQTKKQMIEEEKAKAQSEALDDLNKDQDQSLSKINRVKTENAPMPPLNLKSKGGT
jgi:hypothetical protein